MNNLEYITNRYLDGEMGPEELREYHELLANSEEARRLRESMELIRAAARSFPEMSIPDPTLESSLFQKLFAEEDWAEEESESRRRAGIIPFFRAGIEGIAAIGAGRVALAIPALVLLFLLGSRFLESDSQSPASEGVSAIALASPPERSGTSVAETDRSEESVAESSPANPAGHEDNIRPSAEGRTSEIRPTNEESPIISETPPSVPFAEKSQGPDSETANPDFDDSGSETDQSNDAPAQRPADDVFDIASTDVLPEFDPRDFDRPTPSSDRSSVLSASYRHGLSSFFGEKETVLASGQDLNIRIDGLIADRHRLSVVVGSSPLLVAERTYTTASSVSNDPDEDKKGSQTPSTASVSIEDGNRAEGEVWAGVGYGYTLFQHDNLRLEAGMSAGYGEQSTRYGIELPARLTITDRLGIEVVPYLTRIVPRDQEIRSESTVDSYQEEWRPSSTSVGAQIGLSLSIH